MLRFAMFLIFARLTGVKGASGRELGGSLCLPVLEPDLYRPLGHVDIVRNSFSDHGGGSRVLVKLDL